MTIRFLLFRLFLIAILPLFCLAAYLQYQNTTKDFRRLQDAGASFARNMALAVDDEVLNGRLALQVLAQAIRMDSPESLKTSYGFARDYQAVIGQHVVLADLSKQMIFNTRVPFGTSLPKLPEPRGTSAVTTLLKTGRPAVGDMFDGPIAGQPLVAIAVPVRRNETTTAILISVTETQRFQELLDQRQYPDGWSAVVRDSSGRVMASRGQLQDTEGAEDPSGNLTFAATSAKTPWTVTFGISKGALVTALARESAINIVLFLVLLLLPLWAGIRQSRQLARSISSLTTEQPAATTGRPVAEVETVRRLMAESETARDAARFREMTAEQRFRTLAEQAPVGMYQATADGMVTFVNPAWERQTGYTQEQALGTGWLAAVHPGDRERMQGVFVNGIKSDKPFGAVFRWQRPDGAVVWVVGHGEPERNSDGQTVGIIGTTTDINEIKELELGLRQSEERMQKLFECTPESISIVRLSDGRILSVNDSFTALSGHTQNQVEDRTFKDIGLWKNPVDRENYMAVLRRDGIVRDMLAVLLTKDGAERTCRVAGATTEIGDETLLISVFRDVTEPHEALEALRLSEERFRLAMRGANDGLWDWNTLTGEVYFSPRWKAMLGYEEADLPGRIDEMESRIHPDDRAAAMDSIRQCLDGVSTSLETEFRLRHRNGTWVDILARGFVVRSVEGDPVRFVGTIIDISNRRRREEMLLQYQKVQAIGEMTSGIAHDFNNILAIIIGSLESAEEQGYRGDDIVPLCETAFDAALRGAELIRRLQTYSRSQPSEMRVTGAAGVFGDLALLIERLMPPNVRLEWSVAAGTWAVFVDHSQLENALINLTLNARDAMPDGGVLSLEARNAPAGEAEDGTDNGTDNASRNTPDGPPDSGDYVLFSIADTGSGMPADVRDRIFEPFFTTKEEGKGTGLGLAMVAGFVTESGGHIMVDSTAGEGTRVRLYLPRAET